MVTTGYSLADAAVTAIWGDGLALGGAGSAPNLYGLKRLAAAGMFYHEQCSLRSLVCQIPTYVPKLRFNPMKSPLK